MKRNLEVGVLSIGKVNIQSGKTKYGWSIYDDSISQGHVFLASGVLIYGANKDDFKVGDIFTIKGHDSHRKLRSGMVIEDVSIAKKDDVVEMLLKHEYDYRPAKPFKKKEMRRKLTTSYSVKSIKLV